MMNEKVAVQKIEYLELVFWSLSKFYDRDPDFTFPIFESGL